MAFRHKSGYQDLDENYQSSSESLQQEILNTAQSNVTPNRIFSASDTAINLRPSTDGLHFAGSRTRPRAHNRSMFSLSNSINLGSICLLRPVSSAEDAGWAVDASPNVNDEARKLLRRAKREDIWLLGFVVSYMAFLAVGAVCFRIIETPLEQEIRTAVQLRRDDFMRKYPLVLDEDLEEFLSAVIAANDRGISPLRNASNEMNWSFGQALFFSSTVVTTIGYGRVTPLSQTGKIFCIIYAILGIPLTLVLLSAVVERLLVPANWLLGTLNSKLGHLYQPFNIRLLHLSIVVLLVAVLFFAVPTAVFACLEPAWGVLDAFYYCFISLTTIGLGDYIPGDGVAVENLTLYKIFITIYLICGLIAMMFVLTIFYDIPQLNLGQLFTESVNGESEKLRLSSNNATCYSGPSGLYMPQRDEDTRRAVVRIRPHGGDSPSPDEQPTSLNRDMKMP